MTRTRGSQRPVITYTYTHRQSCRQRRSRLLVRRGCSVRWSEEPCAWRRSTEAARRPAGSRWRAPGSRRSASQRGVAAGRTRRRSTPGNRPARGSSDPSRSPGRTPRAGSGSSESPRLPADSRRAGGCRSPTVDVAVFDVHAAASVSAVSWRSASVHSPTTTLRRSLRRATVARVRFRRQVQPRRSTRDSSSSRQSSLWQLSGRRTLPT